MFWLSLQLSGHLEFTRLKRKKAMGCLTEQFVRTSRKPLIMEMKKWAFALTVTSCTNISFLCLLLTLNVGIVVRKRLVLRKVLLENQKLTQMKSITGTSCLIYFVMRDHWCKRTAGVWMPNSCSLRLMVVINYKYKYDTNNTFTSVGVDGDQSLHVHSYIQAYLVWTLNLTYSKFEIQAFHIELSYVAF